MKDLIQRIKAIFKIARLASSSNVGDFLQGQFVYMGSNAKGQVFIPYGTIGRPPDGSQVALFAQNGNESNGIGFASDPKNRIKPDAAAGEHGIANYVSGSFIFMDNAGNIEISSEANVTISKAVNVIITASGAATITVPTMTINSDVTINGDLVNNGITFDTHIHSQGVDGNGDTEVDTDGPADP